MALQPEAGQYVSSTRPITHLGTFTGVPAARAGAYVGDKPTGESTGSYTQVDIQTSSPPPKSHTAGWHRRRFD